MKTVRFQLAAGIHSKSVLKKGFRDLGGLGFSSGFRGLGFRVSLGIHPHEFSS